MGLMNENSITQVHVTEDFYIKGSGHNLDVVIIIPHYDSPAFCKEAISSLNAGRYSLGVLVMDDGSSEDNYKQLKKMLSINWACIDEIRVVRINNVGAYQARLYAVSLTTSTYIKFLDQDDVLMPGILEKEIDYGNSSGASVLMTDWEEKWITDEPNQQVIRHTAPDYDDPLLGFLKKGGVYTSAALYRRCVLSRVLPVNTWKPRLSDDWVIFGQVLLQVIESNGLYSTLHEQSYQWRHHVMQLSADTPVGHTREFYQFLLWFEDQLRNSAEIRPNHKIALASYYTKNALFLCYIDQTLWRQVANKINELSGEAEIWEGHNSFLKLMVRLLGIYYGVKFYVVIKQWVRPFPFGKNFA